MILLSDFLLTWCKPIFPKLRCMQCLSCYDVCGIHLAHKGKTNLKVHPKVAKGQCCAMWDNMEAKVSGLVTSMNEIKELLFMKGNLGYNLGIVVFNATIVEGAHRVPLGGPNLKDIAITLVSGTVDINPIPSSLIWDYKGIGS